MINKTCPICKGSGKLNMFSLKPSEERFIEAAKIFLKYQNCEQQKNLFKKVSKYLYVSETTAKRYFYRLKK